MASKALNLHPKQLEFLRKAANGQVWLVTVDRQVYAQQCYAELIRLAERVDLLEDSNRVLQEKLSKAKQSHDENCSLRDAAIDTSKKLELQLATLNGALVKARNGIKYLAEENL